MGWIEYRLALRPSPDRPQAHAADELQKIIWDRWARIFMGNRLRGRAYFAIFNGGYIDSQAAGGFAVKKWKFDEGALLFLFHDGDGAFALESRACAHFTEVSYATMLAFDHFSRSMKFEGWILEPPRDATTVLNDCATPFIDLRGALYMISPGAHPGAAPALLNARLRPELAFADLTAAEQSAVLRAIEQRRCACLLCEYYRPRVERELAKRAAKEEKAPKAAASKPAVAKKAAVKKADAKKPAVVKKAAAKKAAVKKPRG